MEIKLIKITRGTIYKNNFYVDFEVIDRKFLIKGMSYNPKKNTLFFPHFLTEKGIKYSPFIFTDPADVKEFVVKCIQILQSTPLPERKKIEPILEEKQPEPIKKEMKIGKKNFTEVELPKKAI